MCLHAHVLMHFYTFHRIVFNYRNIDYTQTWYLQAVWLCEGHFICWSCIDTQDIANVVEKQ